MIRGIRTRVIRGRDIPTRVSLTQGMIRDIRRRGIRTSPIRISRIRISSRIRTRGISSRATIIRVMAIRDITEISSPRGITPSLPCF